MEVLLGPAQHRVMKPNTFKCIASIMLTLTLASIPVLAKDAKTNVPRVTVRVVDYAHLSAETLSELESNATRVLASARIPVDFVEGYWGGADTGDGARTQPLGPAILILRICQTKMAVRRGQLGYAAMTSEGGAYITVFVNPAQQMARVSALSNGVFLGHAVAHEIGHLLLGANSHSSAGIMRPVWRPVDEEWMTKRALIFDAGQSSRMQMALMARIDQ